MKEREQTIEFEMNYCQHYTADTIFGRGGVKATGLCAAGVKVVEVRKGQERMRPCIGGHHLVDATAVCSKWIRRTREQGEAQADALDDVIRKMTIVTPVIREWRNKPPRGKQEVIECPVCKGRLHLSQSSYNGHVHGRCETDDCLSWME